MRLSAARGPLAWTVLVMAACSSKTPVEAPADGWSQRHEEVRVWFGTLHVPASIAADESLVMRLSGSAGPDLCYGFRRVEHARDSSTIELIGFGLRWFDLVCAAQPAEFDVEYRIPPPFLPGQLHLVARQPDGSYLERIVNVRSTR